MSDTNRPASDAFRPQQSANQAKHQLAQWVPLRSSIADAVNLLQAQGFTCQDAAPLQPDAASSVLCTRSPPPPVEPSQRTSAPATPVHWFVTLDSSDGTTVSHIAVARTPKDIEG